MTFRLGFLTGYTGLELDFLPEESQGSGQVQGSRLPQSVFPGQCDY